ncbi:O-antigen ligase family protein [Phenylobacterium sp. VNQ135]|uniref:O-antigen ligase family protein n=1 Tax=Phenylobacterium sp. VNQ135 TaxID=3400922 RepID=UPI003C06501F
MSTTWEFGRGRRHNPAGRLREAGEESIRPRRLRGEQAEAGPSRRDQADARVLRLVDERLVEQRLEAAQHPAVGWRLGALRLDADGVFAFLMFLPLLFIAQLQMIGAAALVAIIPAYAWIRRERLVRTMLPRAFLFLLPAFALFSVVWSEAPKESFKLAIELGLTVLGGLLLTSARDQGAVLRGLALAFLAYVAASIAFGGSVAVGVGAGGYAFSGLSGSKNLLGDIASAGMIISVALAMLAIKQRNLIWLGVAGVAMLLDLYVVVAARSAGALLGLGLGVGALLALAPLLAVGKAVRGWLTGAVALCILAGGLSYRWLTQTMIEVGAQVFDKDPTLTGRTYLWYRAADLIQEKPVLGRGYYAFWQQGNMDAEGLWRYFGIEERGGFTFHNTGVELLVTLGWVGLILFAAVALIGVIALVKRFVERPSIALLCWMSLLLYMLARTPIETIGVAPFYFSTVLGFAALGAGFGRVKLPRQGHAYAPGNVVRLSRVDYSAAGWAQERPQPAIRRLRSPGR